MRTMHFLILHNYCLCLHWDAVKREIKSDIERTFQLKLTIVAKFHLDYFFCEICERTRRPYSLFL